MAPEQLLSLLKRLEREAGRVRGPRDGPRPLDLDLLVYGEVVSTVPSLVLPHPRLGERRFVLAPLAELAPGLRVPGLGRTIGELLEAAPPSRVRRTGPLRGA